MFGKPTKRGSATISDIDLDHYDPKKLQAHEMYDSRNPKTVGKYISNAEVAGYESFELVLNCVVEEIYENYLNSKQTPYIIKGSLNLVDLILATDFSIFDSEFFNVHEDSEPPVQIMDTWGRSKIITKKGHDHSYMDGQNTKTGSSMLMEDRKTFGHARDKAKHFINDARNEPMPAPIDLQEAEETNKTEDDLRQLKDRELRRKEDEDHQQKLKHEQEKQAKFNKKEADLKKKPFTYDYNGNIILVHQTKAEKLPPSAYLVNYHIPDPEVENPKKDKKKKPQDVNALKSKLKKAPEAEKEFANKIASYGSAPPLSEMIELTDGVTLIEGGRVLKPKTALKKGNVTMMAGTLMSTDGGPIRLTKTEYAQLTRGGNLSRPGTEKDPLFKDTLGRIPTEPDKASINNATWSIKVEGVKDIDFKKQKTLKQIQENRSLGKGIKEVNYNALDTLIRATEEDHGDTIKSAPVHIQHTDKYAVDDTFKKSPIDTFNLEIINARDWGSRTGASGIQNNLPQLPPHKEKQLKSSLGFKAKYPRERALNVPMSRTQSEMLLKSLKS
jgi:hypothetical protein